MRKRVAVGSFVSQCQWLVKFDVRSLHTVVSIVYEIRHNGHRESYAFLMVVNEIAFAPVS